MATLCIQSAILKDIERRRNVSSVIKQLLLTLKIYLIHLPLINFLNNAQNVLEFYQSFIFLRLVHTISKLFLRSSSPLIPVSKASAFLISNLFILMNNKNWKIICFFFDCIDKHEQVLCSRSCEILCQHNEIFRTTFSFTTLLLISGIKTSIIKK